ncbi:hypothetical protein [Pseudomonas mediterranea]|jgi:hypothetical protein|uniref:HNH endonuclease n=1 Tax=Pseudomonas mediterranea TaxID=183795 RepID=A0AAX2D6C4_9PSED|nr:hypothetical protein [Pseudomonas mediterranea]SDU14092.1 hypothetical protein SAMN05216476_0615 [Pseudomonas mediterranea]
MLKTKALDSATLDLHRKVLGARFDSALNLWAKPYGNDFPAFTSDIVDLLKKHRDVLLVGTPSELWRVIQEVDDVDANFKKYLEDRPKRNSKNKYNDSFQKLITQIASLFDYSMFIQKKDDWNAYALVKKHGLRICPYCQLQHVNYHNANEKGSLTLRPPLDHYLPKSRYPYLAVSIQNLVPSCHQCNSSVKLDNCPSKTLPNPFDPATTSQMSFETKFSSIDIRHLKEDDIELEVKGNTPEWDDFANFFRLPERYQWYKPEIHDMVGRAADFSEYDDNLKSLLNRPRYILGFQQPHATTRALGMCLLAIAESNAWFKNS